MLQPISHAPLPTRSQPLQLWLLAGGMSPEHEVSLSSALTALQHFAPGHCLINPVCIRRDGQWLMESKPLPAPFDASTCDLLRATWTAKNPSGLLPEDQAIQKMRESRPDLAFILMHGPQGEDGQIQTLLRDNGIPHTGSGVESSAACMDKSRTQSALKAAGLPIPQFCAITANDDEIPIPGPWVVKPAGAGSSVGVHFPQTLEERDEVIQRLFAEGYQSLLVEEFIQGRELTCGVLEVPTADGWEPVALAPTEIRPREGSFFDYHCKYTPGATEEITPAPLDAAATEVIQDLALKTHRLMGCRGFSRTDFMLRGEQPLILEINTIPGMTPTSLLPQGAQARGIDYAQLLTLLVEGAMAD